jgi:hypothetical protein
MPHNAHGVPRHWIPLPVLPPFASWVVDSAGTFCTLSGPGADHLPFDPLSWVGQRYDEIEGADPAPVALIRRALNGETIAERLRCYGMEWFAIARPEYGADGRVLRVHGTSFLLPDEVSPEGPPLSADHQWVVEETVRQQGALLRSGTVITWNGRRYFRTEEMEEITARAVLLAHAGERIRYLCEDEPSDSRPAPQQPSPLDPPDLRVV